MDVEFFKDSADEFRWRAKDDSGIVHSCHEGFSSNHNAIQNLFLNHAMMFVLVTEIATKKEAVNLDKIRFDLGKDDKIWWKIKAENGEIIGKSHKGFGDKKEAFDNLVTTYTILAMFIASHTRKIF